MGVQVCSYRCIVSHESQLLEDFSLCILQRHNCLGKSAEIPRLPDPPPMAAFQGCPLTHETAEALFIGWLGALADVQTSLFVALWGLLLLISSRRIAPVMPCVNVWGAIHLCRHCELG